MIELEKGLIGSGRRGTEVVQANGGRWILNRLVFEREQFLEGKPRQMDERSGECENGAGVEMEDLARPRTLETPAAKRGMPP